MDPPLRQGAVGQVRVRERDGRQVLEKRFVDVVRRDVEVHALRALAGSDLPVPEVLDVTADAVVMTLLPGERLDDGSPDLRVERLRASASVLRRLHERRPPAGLAAAPDDAGVVRRYQEAGGPTLPLVVPPPVAPTFCRTGRASPAAPRRS